MGSKRYDIQFDSEDQAQSALIQLKLLGATQCQVELLEQSDMTDVDLPFMGFPGNATFSGTAGPSPIFNIQGRHLFNLIDPDDDKEVRALLSFHVDADKEAQILDAIAGYGGRLH